MSKGPTRFKQTEIGELPEEWEVVKLGEVVDIYDNLRVPLSAKQRANMQGKYPYCGANGIVDYINDYIFDGEYVLLAEDGGYWGAFETSAYIMSGKFWVNNHAHVLKGKSGILVNHFLMYTLNFMDLTGYVGGTTRGKLTQNEMKKILIPLPPLEEQKRIAGVLRLVDRVAEETRRIVDIYERAKRFALKRLLTRGIGHTRFKQTEIGELPEEWEVKPLSDVLLDSQSGEWGKDVKEFNPDLHEPMRIIRSTEFTKDCRLLLGTAAERAIPKKKATKILLQEGDILVERSGGGPTQPVGRVVFVEKLTEGNWGFGNFIQRLRVKPEYHPRYIWAVLFWHWLNGSVLAMQEQTTGIRNLRWSDYLNLPIPLPPLEEQKQIAEMLGTIDSAIENEMRYLGVLEKCKRWLLDNLLTGKIRLPSKIDDILKEVLTDAS
jgi:type I restriction enzyme S subunit